MTVREARDAALKILQSPQSRSDDTGTARPFVPSPSPRLDCDIILSAMLGIERSALIAHPERELGDLEGLFFEAIRRRAEGMPVAYITGYREFWGLPFRVTSDVLIPKPDTEILVERASAIIQQLLDERSTSPERGPVNAMDVCTGSGCIAISLKHSFPAINMTATDISPAALAVARYNGEALLPEDHFGPCPIRFIEGDLRNGLPSAKRAPSNSAFCAVSGTETGVEQATPNAGTGYDIVVSNPPYVPAEIARALLADGRNEPILALDGGKDGLDLVRELSRRALEVLSPGGILLVETGEYNAKEAAEFFRSVGYANVRIHRDLEGQDRVIEGTAQ